MVTIPEDRTEQQQCLTYDPPMDTKVGLKNKVSMR